MTASEFSDELRNFKRDLTFELQKRERPDRHPYQVGCLVGILIVSIAQLVMGVPDTSALYKLDIQDTMNAMSLSFIVGAVITLQGAMLDRDEHFELSLHLGVWGHLSTFVSSVVFSMIVMSTTPFPYWAALATMGMSIGIAYASAHRFVQMSLLLRAWRKRRKGRSR